MVELTRCYDPFDGKDAVMELLVYGQPMACTLVPIRQHGLEVGYHVVPVARELPVRRFTNIRAAHRWAMGIARKAQRLEKPCAASAA